MRPLILLSTAAALAALAPSSAADFITGRVVDAQGNGIAGVDIDVKNLGGGGDPPIMNDGTDANGFFNTTVPNGFYRITFTPPAPPASSSLLFEIDDVTVTGTLNMGVLTAPAGVALTGTVIGPGGLAVAGVNMDVIDSTGTNLDIAHDTTSPTGAIAMAVPLGPIEVRFDTTPVAGQTLAPTFLELDLSADHSIGTLQLEQGYTVTALLRRPGGFAVVDADVDVVGPNGALYTPGDNSDGVGFVDFVVPAGTFDFEICPQFANQLVALRIPGFTVSSNTSLGIQNLQAGVVLSGTVRNGALQPVAGVDVNVKVSGTGADVLLCGDNTNAAGAYAVVVPTGTFDVDFSPPYSQPLAAQELTGVSVAGSTTLNGSLPACSFFSTSGSGTAGSGGFVPSIAATTTPRIGNPSYDVQLAGGIGGGTALVFAGFTRGSRGGVPIVEGAFASAAPRTLVGGRGVPGAGSATVSFPIPADASLLGESVVAFAWVLDPGAPGGLALTANLTGTICP